jgi:hypothetical protein
MSTTVSLTVSEMIETVLAEAYRHTERPLPLVVGSNDLTASSADNTLTLSLNGGNVQVGSVMEFGQELLLVTSKDSTPTFTVLRGHAGTTIAAHPQNDAGVLDPYWTRADVQRALVRSVSWMNSNLPKIATSTLTVATSKFFAEVPANTIKVLEVGINSTNFQDYKRIGPWEFVEDLPVSVSSTTKIVKVPTTVGATTSLIVKRQVPWAWETSQARTPASESDTLLLYVGSEDLPTLFAAAYLTARREVSRTDLDRVEEWNQEAAIRQGYNLRLMQALWQEVYRRLDEAKRNVNTPRFRVYRKQPTSRY